MITDISPSCVGPALDRILTLRPERGSLHSTIQARINTLTVLAEFLTSDEKDKSGRSFTGSTRDTAAQRVHTYTGWLRTATTSEGEAKTTGKTIGSDMVAEGGRYDVNSHGTCSEHSCYGNFEVA